MREIFNYDLHTHTTHSDGRSSIAEMAQSAEACGLKGLAITDHVFHRGAMTWLPDARREIDAAQRNCKTILALGAEGVILTRKGEITIEPSLRENLDIALVELNMGLGKGVFESWMSKSEAIGAACEALVNACGNPCFEIIAHPFNLGRLPWKIDLRDIADSALLEVASSFAANGKAFEIMNQMYWWHPSMAYDAFEGEYLRILEIFKDRGVKFSMGSDTHSCCGTGNLRWSEKMVQLARLEESSFFIPPVMTSPSSIP